MSESAPSTRISLPAGVTIGAGRETSELNAAGQVVQGIAFPITTAGGTTATVFVPNSELHQTAKVQALFKAKADAITAITG